MVELVCEYPQLTKMCSICIDLTSAPDLFPCASSVSPLVPQRPLHLSADKALPAVRSFN